MMEKLKFDYSMKNISVTTERSYLLKLIEQIEMVIKRMRWKVIYCDMKENSIKTETYGLKSLKAPLPINENDLIELVKNIKFRTVQNQPQKTVKSDIKLNQQISKTLTPADKTSDMYRLAKEEYNKMRRTAIMSTYKKVNGNIKKRINEKRKEIVKKSFDNIIDRMDVNAESSCFVTIKDHKENFLNPPKVRLSTQQRMRLEE